MSRKYSIDDKSIDDFIKQNNDLINKTSADDLKKISKNAKSKWKKFTKTYVGLTVSIIIVIVILVLLILSVTGLLQLSLFDKVKLGIILIMLFITGFLLYMF
jgi:uncharacterized integral membrane protein